MTIHTDADGENVTVTDYEDASIEQLESLADMYWRHREQAVKASRAAGPTSGKRWDAHAKKCARRLRAIDDALLRKRAEVDAESDGDASEDPNAGKELVTDGGRPTMDAGIPEDAMQVDHGIEHSDHENYVRFTVTDVIEWWTKSEDGTVTVEKFVADDPDVPEDIMIGLAATPTEGDK